MTKPTSIWQHIKKALTPPASPTDHKSVLFDKTKANATGQEAIDEVRAIKAAKHGPGIERLERLEALDFSGYLDHMQALNVAAPEIGTTWAGSAQREQMIAWLEGKGPDDDCIRVTSYVDGMSTKEAKALLIKVLRGEA